jgi:hypothetical protein
VVGIHLRELVDTAVVRAVGHGAIGAVGETFCLRVYGLALIDGLDGALVEKADIQQAWVGAAAEDGLEDAALVGDGIVGHQFGDFSVKFFGIVWIVVVTLVKTTPRKSLLLAMRRYER